MEKIKKRISNNGLLLVAILMFVLTGLLNKSFLTSFNINALLTEISFMGFLRMGMTFVLLTGGTDLSVGAVAGLSTVIIAMTMKHLELGNPTLTVLVGIVLAIVVCTALGIGNGLLVTYLKLPPLIVTLGMSWVAMGLGQMLLKGAPLALSIKSFRTLMTAKLLNVIPVSFLITVAALAFLSYVLRALRFGREFYAVGSNKYAAFISGTNTNAVLIKAYAICGGFAGIAGLLIAAYTGSGYPAAANNYETYTIAAVVMGGTSMNGGEGKIAQTLIGVAILRLLNKLVVFSGLSSISGYIEGIIIGTILIIVLLINTSKEGEQAK